MSGLLGRPDVQKDLNLSADQISKIDEARTAARAAGGGGGGNGGGGGGAAGGGTPPDPAAMAARQAERDKPFLDILTDAQKIRVHEIQLQIEGDSAAARPEVQTALGLTDDQKSAIKDLQAKQQEANAAAMEKMRNQEIDRTAFRTAMTTNTQALKDGIHKVLTDAQIAKLKDMGGKPFVADPPGGR